jgi:DUF4097 and DUF4098 domain-containing protein YvlB
LLTQVETSNGSVSVTQMNGDSNIKSSNGTITVMNVQGNVKADTSNGAGTFTDITGSVDMMTNNGSLTLEHITGTVAAESSNGSIKAASIINGKWNLVTSNGKITLAIPRNTNAAIEGKTSNGKVDGNVQWKTGEKTHRSGIIGSGVNEVTLSSSNGNIDVNFEN